MDCCQGYDDLELLSNYVNEHAGIPLVIMDSINRRAAELEWVLERDTLPPYRREPALLH